MNKKFEKLVNEFKKLNLPEGEYAIYGSGPLAIRGLRDANDLDVIVSDSLYQKLKKQYSKDSKKERVKIGEIEIYPAWVWEPQINGLEEMIKRAELIRGLRFIRLNDLLNCKKKMGRPKDFKDIKLIKSYLESQKSKN
jgi:hypothetical protein